MHDSGVEPGRRRPALWLACGTHQGPGGAPTAARRPPPTPRAGPPGICPEPWPPSRPLSWGWATLPLDTLSGGGGGAGGEGGAACGTTTNTTVGEQEATTGRRRDACRPVRPGRVGKVLGWPRGWVAGAGWQSRAGGSRGGTTTTVGHPLQATAGWLSQVLAERWHAGLR